MGNISKRLSLMFLLLFLCLGAVQAVAQLDSGSIAGIVKDKSGAVVVGATVKVINNKTGRVQQATTGSIGEYTVPGLPAGPYSVEATQKGFKTGLVSNVVLQATQSGRADVTLDVGSVDDVVNINAQQTTVNTQTSDLGGSITSSMVTNLPLNGRDFTALVALVPGSITTAGFGQASLSGFGTGTAGVNVLLDGADATRIDTNATSTQLGRQESRISRASVDSVQEFRVIQSTYSAEYGRSMGDVINVITKSGGNDLHGTAFEYLRNNKLDARNYFALGEEPLHMNQFGGNLSGPVIKNKLFFFVNYEGVRQSITSPVQAQVLSSYYRGLAVATIKPVIDAIPVGNGGTVLKSNGTPLLDAGGHPVREYFNGHLRDTLREDTGSAKIDWAATQKDSFAFRYNINDSFTSTEYGVAAGQTAPSSSRNHLLKGTWNHTFTPSLLNEFGVAFNRPQTDSLGGGGGFDTLFQCVFCNDSDPLNPLFTLGSTPGPALFSSRRPQRSFQFIDNLSWIKGRHSIRFGTDIRMAHTQDELQPQRFISYAGLKDFVNNGAFQISTLGYNTIGVSNTNYGFFFQDDIHLTSRLTVNLGVRYDYNSVLKSDQIANFDIATLSVLPTGASLYNPDRNNFAPRIGFAYDPFGNGKTVIRGGFGIFYSPLLTGAALSLAGNNQPGFNINILDDLFGVRTCTPALSWTWPLPATLPTCVPAAPFSVNALDRNMRDSYSEHWSFGVQHEIFANTVLELSYVGNKGVKLPAGASGAGLELNFDPFGGPNRLSKKYANVRRLGNFLSSKYDALQVSARRHVGKGVNIDANYTWAHEFDDAVGIFSAFQNSLRPKDDWSEGDIDVRHNFTLGLVYDIPVASVLPKRLAQGWQIASIFQVRSGLPVNITNSSPFLGIDLIRPNLVPGVPLYLGEAPGAQLNPAAFADAGVGQYGNLRRNAVRGPGFNQLDMNLSKTTTVTERLSMQLRLEMFNIFNHPNFVNPVGVLTDPNFGKSKSTLGNHVGTGTARQTQLALKFLF